MAVLGLRFCARASSSCGKRRPLFITVRGPLTLAASLVAEHRLQTRRLSNCGSRAQLLRGMWDLPRPGFEPVSPALAGRFSTTAPPGKPWTSSNGQQACLTFAVEEDIVFIVLDGKQSCPLLWRETVFLSCSPDSLEKEVQSKGSRASAHKCAETWETVGRLSLNTLTAIWSSYGLVLSSISKFKSKSFCGWKMYSY